MKFLVTGAAGFIGFHVSKRLLEDGFEVVGIDSINDYYDVQLKYARLSDCGISTNNIEYNNIIQSHKFDRYKFLKLNIEDQKNLEDIFKANNFDIVIHLAAQAGVRYSIENPRVYIESNILGFFNILENCKAHAIKHLVFASSSSVYGNNKKIPFSTDDNVDYPISLYAATKKSNELMAYTYSHLYKIPITGLRFFTVYGPWGRPDMAYFSFMRNLIENKPIKLYNQGNLKRDFTYIDDVVEGIRRIKDAIPEKQNDAFYKIYNIGNSSPITVKEFIATIEQLAGKEFKKEMLPMQPGDVEMTYADVSELEKMIDYKPHTEFADGMKCFIDWYLNYNKITKNSI